MGTPIINLPQTGERADLRARMSAYLLRRVRVACDQRQACSDQWEGGDQTGKLPSILFIRLAHQQYR